MQRAIKHIQWVMQRETAARRVMQREAAQRLTQRETVAQRVML